MKKLEDLLQTRLENDLSSFWKYYCKLNDLPLMSADELLFTHHLDNKILTNEQERVVNAFINLWELTI